MKFITLEKQGYPKMIQAVELSVRILCCPQMIQAGEFSVRIL